MPTITHSFVSSIADDAGASAKGEVLPSHWNAAHTDSSGNAITVRTILSADKNYYVAVTGSDSNPGTLAQPWATLQHALDFIAENVDLGGFSVTVNLADGTYDGASLIAAPVGTGFIRILGNSLDQTLVTIKDNGADGCFGNQCGMPQQVRLSHITFQSNIPGQYAINADAPYANIALFNCTFTSTVVAGGAIGLFWSHCQISAQTCEIRNSWNYFIDTQAGNNYFETDSNINCVGTPSFAVAFANISLNCTFGVFSSFTGAATGKRFICAQGGVILSSNPNALPGNAPGTVDSTSSYGGVIGANVNYQQPANAFTITLADGDTQVILDPAAGLAAGTITMQASPIDGQVVTIRSSQTITALTINGNAGQTVVGAPTTIGVGGTTTAVYKASNTTWYF